MIMPVAPVAADPRAVFLRRESEVRSYCRSFPVVFAGAKGSWLTDEDGNHWLDFLAGAGSLNYGHNDPAMVQAVCDHLQSGGIACSLDLHSAAKRRFLEAFECLVLAPRGLDYKVQFCGPTGTNGVEAALKLVRKATRRSGVAAFTSGYHGMSLGSLAVSSSGFARGGAGVPLGNSIFLPYDGWHGPHVDTMDIIEDLFANPSSGVDLPAAVILECVQGEGGLNVATTSWLQRLALLCRRRGILLIVDEVQTGCGRAGTFFSFEAAEIVPDLVVLSKSIGGIGQPLSLVLMRPDLDRWQPGEHNGTFRGNNLAFVAGTIALERYWDGRGFEHEIAERADLLGAGLASIRARHPQALTCIKGRGLMQGLSCSDPAVAERIGRRAFQRGLIIERCGPHDEVVKAMPPLNIPLEDLRLGIGRLGQAVDEVLAD